MAAEAIIHNIGVVKIRRNPRDRRMTVVTVIAAGDVGRVLARRRDTVVARAAGAKNLRVIHREYWFPHI